MKNYRAVFYEPGHFHAALTLRALNPRLAKDIHVYASPGPERDAFLALVESFNRRAEDPTSWKLHLYEGDRLLERLIADGYGDFAVIAGRNDTKLKTLARLTEAGLHVLADKPWLTHSSQLPDLERVTVGPRLAMDIMTVRHAVVARLIHQVVCTQDLFGSFAVDDGDQAAIDIASVHHLCKMVNGRPLKRPIWYYDTAVQGDGLVDIQSHMVDQAQWWVLDDEPADFGRDVVLDAARRWSTPVPPDLFHESTGHLEYPESIQSGVRDGVLAYACNGEIRYRLRGVPVRQTAQWGQREPEGTGDTHQLTVRGTRCRVIARLGPETGYRSELHLQPVNGFELEPALRSELARWHHDFPGLSFEPSELGLRLVIPLALDHGHESHFPLVLSSFLDHLDRGRWPESLPARIRMRYTLLARAQALASNQAG